MLENFQSRFSQNRVFGDRPLQFQRAQLVLITNKKSYMSFRLVPKSVTLNDLERRNGRYIALFH